MNAKVVTLVFSLFLAHINVASSDSLKYKDRCSTLSCVHSSATIVQKINTAVDPCEDFYEYACGSFLEEQHPPDEKSTVDTLTIMKDKLTEYLLTLLTKPAGDSELKLHKLAKNLYKSCNDVDQVNQRGKAPLENLIKAIGNWPMLEGKNWDESKFKRLEVILRLRKYISGLEKNIFKISDFENEIEKTKNFAEGDKNSAKVESSLKTLIHSVVTSLKVGNSTQLTEEIEALIEFEKNLDLNQRKNKKFRKQHQKYIQDKKNGFKENSDLKTFIKHISYLNAIDPFVLADPKDYDEDVPLTFHEEYLDFIQNTPKRTIANFIFWRIVQASLQFQDKDLRNIVLTFEKDAFGKEDTEQRWIFCTDVVLTNAPVAVGSLYISHYFTATDKKNAERLVKFILDEYKAVIENSTWMDEPTRKQALIETNKIVQYIGYHESLNSSLAEEFYNTLPEIDDKNFFETGLAFKIFSADREFKILYSKREKYLENDWTKYSKPATVNAFYNSKDTSIQFPAAILQTPNFDKDRPAYMNFGAIGSIIGHEITHAFDNQALKYESWSEDSKKDYLSKVQCIVDQYSRFRVPEIEKYLKKLNGTEEEFHLQGKLTQKEDIADCGGIKLAFNAFQKFAKEFPESNAIPLGLEEFSSNQLFWLSFAQTFCSVERPIRMKQKVETDVHTLDKFRIIGTLSNMKEFADDWKCPEKSRMNPEKKCAVW